jgi:hypothetical protein
MNIIDNKDDDGSLLIIANWFADYPGCMLAHC